MSTESLAVRLDRWSARLYSRVQGWAAPRYTIGPSLFRVLFGAFALYQLLINYAQRHFLFGPEGVWPFDLFQSELAVADSFSLYAWSRSPLWFEGVYHAHVLVAALWMLGFYPRVLTPILWVFHWSVHERFAMLWDGGDNMGYLILLYLCFADVGQHFAPLARSRASFAADRPWDVALGLLHNFALLACIIQVCILYFSAGVAKLGGEYWQNGTALYYALRAAEYSVTPELGRAIWGNPYLLTFFSYTTVLFQLSFPFVVLFGTPFFRIAIVGAAVSFHLGILGGMGLVTFGLFMLAYEPLLLRDEEFTRLFGGERLRSLAESVPRQLGRLLPRKQTADVAGDAASKAQP